MNSYFTVGISIPARRGLSGGKIFQSRMFKSAADARAEADEIAASNKAPSARACIYTIEEHIGAAQVIETPYNPYTWLTHDWLRNKWSAALLA